MPFPVLTLLHLCKRLLLQNILLAGCSWVTSATRFSGSAWSPKGQRALLPCLPLRRQLYLVFTMDVPVPQDFFV